MTAPLPRTIEKEYARIFIRSFNQRRGILMDDSSPLLRQWVLLRTLSARHYGVTVKEMAQELRVSEKTVRRDLETFLSAGFPIVETVEDFGRKKYRLDPSKNSPGMTFACDEAIALFLGRRFLEPLAGTFLWDAAQRAFKKIRASLGESALKYTEKFAPIFHKTMIGASDYSKKAEMIDQLMVGIEDRRAVFISYHSLQATEPVTYDIYPYGLVYHHDSLYLIGRKPDKKEIGHWKVDRITDAEVTEVRFQTPKDFDLKRHLSSSFGI